MSPCIRFVNHLGPIAHRGDQGRAKRGLNLQLRPGPFWRIRQCTEVHKPALKVHDGFRIGGALGSNPTRRMPILHSLLMTPGLAVVVG